MHMKRLLGRILCISAALLSAACSGKGKTVPEETERKPLKIAYIVTRLGDRAYCDSGEKGMEQLRQEGFDVTTYEFEEDSSRYPEQMEDVIRGNHNLILASSDFSGTVDQAALEHPDVNFVLVDARRDPQDLLANEAALYFAQNEGSYLIGALSAALTETNTVAIDVGMTVPVIRDFVSGYVNGVLDWNAANGTDVRVVMASVDSWNDPDGMKKICLDQVKNSHADIFYQVAGGSGNGLFEACAETGTWAIGVDSDQYEAFKESDPEKAAVILTSMVKEVGNSLIEIVHQIDEGQDIWKKTEVLGLRNKAVGYVNNELYRTHVPQRVRTAVEKAAEEVRSGRIQVKSYFDFKDEAEYLAYIQTAQ